MRRRAVLAACAGLLLGACHRRVPGADPVALAGLTLPLRPSPGVALAVSGAIGELPAEVRFDVGAPLGFVTAGCLDGPPARGLARIDSALGPSESFPVVEVRDLQLGGVRLRAFDAAVADGPGCVVALGDNVLRGLALDVRVARRELTLRASQSAEAWEREVREAGVEAQLVRLTREPTHDWPLLPIRLTRAGRALTATVLLATRERQSWLFSEVTRGAGLSAPGARAVGFDGLELTAGVGVGPGALRLEAGAPLGPASGVVASDVWGRFDAAIDVGAGLLVLCRPRLLTAGERASCGPDGAASEAACFELQTARDEGGAWLATATVWRPLPVGAQLFLEVEGVAAARCRVGFSFPPGGRGRSTQHALPWPRLTQALPECADALFRAQGLSFGLYQDGAMAECPGLCAFAHDLETGRVTCECQPEVTTDAAGAVDEADMPDDEPEPADP